MAARPGNTEGRVGDARTHLGERGETGVGSEVVLEEPGQAKDVGRVLLKDRQVVRLGDKLEAAREAVFHLVDDVPEAWKKREDGSGARVVLQRYASARLDTYLDAAITKKPTILRRLSKRLLAPSGRKPYPRPDAAQYEYGQSHPPYLFACGHGCLRVRRFSLRPEMFDQYIWYHF